MSRDLSQELGRNIPLSEMLETLRQELTVSQRAGADRSVQFDVEEVELELQVAVSSERSGEGKINFWVVGLGGDASSGRQDIHRFTLKLKPRGRRGEPLSVSDDNALSDLPER